MLRAAGVAAQSLGITIKAVGGACTAATIPLSAFLTTERQRRRLIGCADFIVVYERAAMSRVRVSRSSTAGPMVTTDVCRNWRPISPADKSP
jgi:hypothetical protein